MCRGGLWLLLETWYAFRVFAQGVLGRWFEELALMISTRDGCVGLMDWARYPPDIGVHIRKETGRLAWCLALVAFDMMLMRSAGRLMLAEFILHLLHLLCPAGHAHMPRGKEPGHHSGLVVRPAPSPGGRYLGIAKRRQAIREGLPHHHLVHANHNLTLARFLPRHGKPGGIPHSNTVASGKHAISWTWLQSDNTLSTISQQAP